MSTRSNSVTTELTTRESTDLAQHQEPVGISGEADPSDFITPIVSLVQGQSAEGTPGYFRSSSGTEKPEVRFVVLHIARTRTFFTENDGLVCRSNDRRTGYPKKPELVADDATDQMQCASCPHYRDNPFGKNVCKLDFALTCYDLDAQEPFLFRVKGAAQGVFKYRIINAVARGIKPPWFTAFVMKSEKRVDKERGRNWYEPVLIPEDEFDTDQLKEWGAYAAGVAPHQAVADDGIDPDDLPFE